MKAKKGIHLFMLVYFFCTLLCFATVTFSQQEGEEVTYQVIRLLSEEIVPPVATIQLGTVVIWVNEDTKPTEIKFTNANSMVIACDGSENYIAHPEKIISTLIPYAGLASLCLVQRGTFNYTVKRGLRELQGTIVVQ